MERYFLLTVLLMGGFGCSKSSNISGNSQAQKLSNIEKSGIGIMTFNTKWLLAGAEQAQRLKGKGIWGLEDKDEDAEIEQQHAAVSEVIANYMYSQAFDRFDVGYSSAIGTLMFFYVMIIVALFGLFRKAGWDI